ncbi:IclR family transcriptional regulator [Pseudoruegeria sp. HB172150]|uniref:IclR family transcriptional regulator n=1 Tax=Pseudoruegeria sp. HB172150 TaxID=2721164 RepID=UPI001552E73F|nr:IclR family transcriptional regulator [Pseudoruegeria sp. HB172150]
MGTISKALELLNYFSRTRPAIGLGEFVRLSGRDKATVHRHLVELHENGFLEQNPESRAYRLGPAILRLSGVREATYPVRSVLRPVVTRMAEAVGELVHASVLQGELLSPAFHSDPLGHGTQVHFDEGEMLPLHATSSGLAVLAFAPDGFREAVLRAPLPAITAQTVTDAGALRGLLDEVRHTGIARLDRAFDQEVASQGAPVFGPAGEVVGAISIAIPAVRSTTEKMDAALPALRQGIVEATRALGGNLPKEHAGKWEVSQPETVD